MNEELNNVNSPRKRYSIAQFDKYAEKFSAMSKNEYLHEEGLYVTLIHFSINILQILIVKKFFNFKC